MQLRNRMYEQFRVVSFDFPLLLLQYTLQPVALAGVVEGFPISFVIRANLGWEWGSI
jgi:hypothetical protein